MGVDPLDSGADGGLTAQRVLLAVTALLAADRDERAEDLSPRRSEAVLSDAGFTPPEIAALTGKNKEAVRSFIRRAQDKRGAA
jgi:DNA-directed RNA polymerase specialized sigma24 family protein